MKNLLVSAILAAALVAPAAYAMSEVEREARKMNLPTKWYMHNSHMHHKKHHKHMKQMKHKHMKRGHMHKQHNPHRMPKGEGTEQSMQQRGKSLEERTKSQIKQETDLTNR